MFLPIYITNAQDYQQNIQADLSFEIHAPLELVKEYVKQYVNARGALRRYLIGSLALVDLYYLSSEDFVEHTIGIVIKQCTNNTVLET